MADRDTLAVLAEELGAAFAPLELALQSQDDFSALMVELGWDLATIPDALAALQAPLATISELLDAGELDADSLPGALHAISSALGAVGQISNATGLPATVDAGAFTAELPRQLVDFVIVDYLLDRHPLVGDLLKLLGVIRLEDVEAAGKRPAFVRRAVAWEDLARVLSTPQAVLRRRLPVGSGHVRPADVRVQRRRHGGGGRPAGHCRRGPRRPRRVPHAGSDGTDGRARLRRSAAAARQRVRLRRGDRRRRHVPAACDRRGEAGVLVPALRRRRRERDGRPHRQRRDHLRGGRRRGRRHRHPRAPERRQRVRKHPVAPDERDCGAHARRGRAGGGREPDGARRIARREPARGALGLRARRRAAPPRPAASTRSRRSRCRVHGSS